MLRPFANVVLKGERLVLRPMREEDAELVVKWRNDPEIRKWFFATDPLTVASHMEWFRQPKADRLDFVICLRDSERPIGAVHYKNIDSQNAKAEAGKMLGDKPSQGKGLAKEAFLLWIDFGFRELNLNRIYVRTMRNNLANIGLNKKLGFKEEGVMREDYRDADGFHDVLVLSILRSEAKKSGMFHF